MPKKKDERKALIDGLKKLDDSVADLKAAVLKKYPDRDFPAGYFGSIEGNLSSIARCIKADIDGKPW